MVGHGDGYADLGPRVFFVWGAFCIVAIFFVFFMVYETSKISLEQIDEMYERVPHAWHSKGFEPSWSFQADARPGLLGQRHPARGQRAHPQPRRPRPTPPPAPCRPRTRIIKY